MPDCSPDSPTMIATYAGRQDSKRVLKGVHACRPYEAFTGRDLLWCHYRVQRIELLVRRRDVTGTRRRRRGSVPPTGKSEQPDLSPRSGRGVHRV